MTYIKRIGLYRTAFVLIILIMLVLMVAASTLGAAKFPFVESLRILASKIPLLNMLVDKEKINAINEIIVINIRMPRIIMAILIGAGLSIVGASFQGMFRNPMADPYVLGISSGAALAATISIILGAGRGVLGIGTTALSAFVGALLTVLLVYGIARIGSRTPPTTLILAGVAVSYLMSSIISLLMVFNRNQLEKIIFWTMGGLSAASWKQIAILAPIVIPGIAAIISFSRELNVMSTGEESAGGLGVDVELVKKLLLATSSIVVGACVAVSGVIGFVGLVVPHAVRLVAGSDHRVTMPFSALVGGIFLLISDTLARTLVSPSEIPVGAITALFGAPYFIFLLVRSKRKVK